MQGYQGYHGLQHDAIAMPAAHSALAPLHCRSPSLNLSSGWWAASPTGHVSLETMPPLHDGNRCDAMPP